MEVRDLLEMLKAYDPTAKLTFRIKGEASTAKDCEVKSDGTYPVIVVYAD